MSEIMSNPNPKRQLPRHSQVPNPNPNPNQTLNAQRCAWELGVNWKLDWDLEVGSGLGFGAWDLGFENNR
jgi:hypothetical protein